MGPMLLLAPEMEAAGAEETDAESRYTDQPNPLLCVNQTVSRGSTHVKAPDIKEGCSFIEPMAGQCGTGPWGF